MEEKKREDNIEKKKKVAILSICFIGALIFIITGVFKQAGAKTEKQQNTQQENTETELDTVKKKNPDTLTADDIEVLKDNADSEPVDTSDELDATYNDSFQLEGIPDETLALINNDTQRMSNCIQETLYANGYYDYTKARFEDVVEIDYSAQTVTVNMKVYANKVLDTSVIYHRDTDVWETVIW